MGALLKIYTSFSSTAALKTLYGITICQLSQWQAEFNNGMISTAAERHANQQKRGQWLHGFPGI
jgi:hypothetical protein